MPSFRQWISTLSRGLNGVFRVARPTKLDRVSSRARPYYSPFKDSDSKTEVICEVSKISRGGVLPSQLLATPVDYASVVPRQPSSTVEKRVSMVRVGAVLKGRYRVDGILGKGGRGTVYLATHLGLGRQVAIKEMLTTSCSGGARARALRMFRLEAQILHDLEHPCLPRVHDFFEVDDTACLVMDLVEGRTLSEILERDEHITEAQVLDWSRQLCEVLDFLHNRHPQVIFRDLKPANVMLTRKGRIKLIDFGLAKIYDEESGQRTLTSARCVLTPGFAALEQYGGTTDVASDVYALGATMYCLLTRRIPEESVSVASGAACVVPLRRLNPFVSKRTANAVEWMMQTLPADRPQAMGEVMQALGFATQMVSNNESGHAVVHGCPTTTTGRSLQMVAV